MDCYIKRILLYLCSKNNSNKNKIRYNNSMDNSNNHLKINPVKQKSIRNKNRKKEKMIMKILANFKDLIKTCSKVSNNKIRQIKR